MNLILLEKKDKVSGRRWDEIEDALSYPVHTTSPVATKLLQKTDIYKDPIEFEEVDQRAITVAQSDTRNVYRFCFDSTVESVNQMLKKLEQFLRWDHQNLNSIMFEETQRGVLPMGLHDQIWHRELSRSVPRDCAEYYAGLHCVVIKVTVNLPAIIRSSLRTIDSRNFGTLFM